MNQNKDKVRSTIYIAAGAYLAYLAYSLFKDMGTSTVNHSVQVAFIAIFAIGGIGLVIAGAVNFQKAGKTSDESEGIYNTEQDLDEGDSQDMIEKTEALDKTTEKKEEK